MKFSRYCYEHLDGNKCNAVSIFVLDGDGEIRTLDPLLARQVLSQLSYAPIPDGSLVWLFRKALFQVLFQVFSPPVGLSGLEPPTSRLSGVRSNRLSYKPILVLARYFLSRIFKNSCCLMMSSLVVLRFSSNNSHSFNMFQSLA